MLTFSVSYYSFYNYTFDYLKNVLFANLDYLNEKLELKGLSVLMVAGVFSVGSVTAVSYYVE